MKNIYISIILFMATLNLFGQETYYWSGGKKQVLTEVENKYVVKFSSLSTRQQARQELSKNKDIILSQELRKTADIIICKQMKLADVQR